VRRYFLICFSLIAFLLSGCGGSSDSSSTPATTPYTIGGTISGLTSGSLVLKNNGGDALTINANSTTFTFATALASGTSYAVTVGTQPNGLTCSVSNGTGTVASANVINVTITCATTTYTVGGTVSGLASGTSVTLQVNSSNPTTVSSNGSFTFSTPLANGTPYEVSIGTQPSGLTCSVSNGTGTVASANVTNVTITCATTTYTVGGTVSGLAPGTSVTLQVNSSNPTTVSSNGSFTFSTPLANGTPYEVSIGTQPTGLSCSIPNGAGTLSGSNVTNVSVSCKPQYVYVTNQGNGTINGTISTYSINSDGTLSNISTEIAGKSPRALAINPSGTFVYVVNNVDRTVSMYSINNDGTLSSLGAEATGQSPQGIAIHPAGTYAYVTALDIVGDPIVNVYEIRSDGTLSILTNGPAFGLPKAIAINPAGTYAYVTDSIGTTLTMNGIYSSGNTGTLYSLSPPSVTTGANSSGITINKQGTFAYVTNRGGTVSMYSINNNGTLSSLGTVAAGSHPNEIVINPAGTYAYVTNSGSSDVSMYSINSDGTLRALTPSTEASGWIPYGIAINAAGSYAYVVNQGDNTISIYSINSDGTLRLVSTAVAGSTPWGISITN
jgi:6-phosphogluconolactonase (cycloisomerase 2 family)